MTIGVTVQDVKELHTILYFMIIVIFNEKLLFADFRKLIQEY